MLRSLFRAVCALALAAVLAPEVHASESWSIAQREDASIQTFVGKLSPHADKAPGAKDATAVVLYKQDFFKVSTDKTSLCRNWIVQVRDVAAFEGRDNALYFDPETTIDDAGAWLLRGDKLTRLAAGEVEQKPSVDEVHRTIVRAKPQGLQQGDILGVSAIVEFRGPLFYEAIPLASGDPVIYSSVRCQGDGQQQYRLLGRGVPPKDFLPREEGLNDGKYSGWKVNVRNLAAVNDIVSEGPFPESMPHAILVLDEIYVEREGVQSAWVDAGGWNQMAAGLHGLVESAVEEMKSVDVIATSLVSVTATPAEKEAAVCEYVARSVDLLQGPDVSQRSVRPGDEIVEATALTAFEKTLLMIGMLRSLDLPAQAMTLVPKGQGRLDTELAFLHQFGAAGVRCGDDAPRFYAPACTDCTSGNLPATWQGVRAFSAVSDLREQGEKFNQAIVKQAAVDGGVDLREVRAKMEALTWHRFEPLVAAGL